MSTGLNICYSVILRLQVEFLAGISGEPPTRPHNSNAYHPCSDQYQERGAKPQEKRILTHWWFHKNERPVTGHQEALYVVIRLPAFNLLADQALEIGGKGGIGFIDRLALTDDAAELLL